MKKNKSTIKIVNDVTELKQYKSKEMFNKDVETYEEYKPGYVNSGDEYSDNEKTTKIMEQR
ncbi:MULTISPECIES: hypothetical protein [Bacillus]|uniref:Uncharacterized protein n=1 Tax=Bacillus mycoides TaxID=1405 RepID=A0A3D9VKQ5_BACMY|nr:MULTISPECIES: hypothetical protein [Bacillus]RBP31498.1 hypothetical protein DET63_101326 [Bacillus sp. DB-2]REF40780.1 hypothetical protein DET55_102152 [Bacillus mycoides]